MLEKVSIHSAGLAIAVMMVFHIHNISYPLTDSIATLPQNHFFWGGGKVDSVSCKCLIPTYRIKMQGLQAKGTISSSHSIKPRSMSYVGNYNHLPTHPVLAKQLKWGFRMQNLPISASKIVAKYFSAIIATHLSIIVAKYLSTSSSSLGNVPYGGPTKSCER